MSAPGRIAYEELSDERSDAAWSAEKRVLEFDAFSCRPGEFQETAYVLRCERQFALGIQAQKTLLIPREIRVG